MSKQCDDCAEFPASGFGNCPVRPAHLPYYGGMRAACDPWRRDTPAVRPQEARRSDATPPVAECPPRAVAGVPAGARRKRGRT